MKRRAASLTGIDRFQRRRERTAHDLLEAAQRALAAKGYHNTKIVDIARAAGVGVGTFYLYYRTKEALFLKLVEDTVHQLKGQLDAVRAHTRDPAESARATTEAFFRFAHENRELFRIVFGHGTSFNDVVRQSQELFVRDVMENLVAGMRKGAFRKGHPYIWAQALIGMAVQVVSWWIDEEPVPIEEVARSVNEMAFHGIAAGSSDC